MKFNKVGERKPPTTKQSTMKIFEQMSRRDLEELHGYVGKAERLMANYRQEGTSLGEFALQCEEYCKLLMLELNAFAAIVERTKKGEVYNG